MQMTLLSITLWFAHFLITPALHFNTLPGNTPSETPHTETTPTTTTTTTTTNQEPETLRTTTPSPPPHPTTTQDITTDSPTEAKTQLNITPNVTFTQETTSLHQYNSRPSQNDVMHNAGDVTMSHTNTLNNPTTVSTNFATPMPHEDDKNETGTMLNLSYNKDGQTVPTPDPFNSISTAFWTEEEDETTKSDEGNYETNSTQATFANMNIARLTPHIDDQNETGTMSNVGYRKAGHTFQTTGPFNSASTASWKEEKFETTKSDEGNYETNSTQNIFANMSISRLTPHTNVKNETGTMSNLSYREDGHTVQTQSFNIVSTASWRDDETTKTDEGNYETNSTQASFAKTNEWTEKGATEGSYNFTNEHKEEHYERTVKVFNLSASTATERNHWPTSQTTDIPMITPTNTISQDPTISDEPELHTSTDGGNHSTTQQHIDRFTSSVAQTENITGTDTPSGTIYTTNNNNSIMTGVSTDNSTNATTHQTNETDSKSKGWPTCFNSGSQSRQSKLVCFITIWTLAMTATIFLGISIFLWVSLSVLKKKIKQKEKGGQMDNKDSLWADPKATVQERVEFWYVNGSTLEADRKETYRKRQERMKRRGREQESEEADLWIQPRVTVNDITEFWYANRRRNETMQGMY